MEKIIYALWKDPAEDDARFNARLLGDIAARLGELAHAVRVNVQDDSVGAGSSPRMTSTRPQMDFATGLTFVGRFESIEQDVAHVTQLIGWPHLKMKHRNASGDVVRYRDRMTAESQAIIAEIYRDDIERLGYR